MKNLIIRYNDNKTDLAGSVVNITLSAIDHFGRDYGEPWLFFYTAFPPASYDDIVLWARKSDVKSIRHQY